MKYLFVLLLLVGCSKKDNSFGYAYAPSIIKVGNTYFNYFCSTGNAGWDSIRLITSQDLKTWSEPVIVLDAPGSELAACDPSVIKLGQYYYMYYTGIDSNGYNAVFVARSSSPQGDFIKYNSVAGFDSHFYNEPTPLIYAENKVLGNPDNAYGAGQSTVINVNNELIQWHTDTTTVTGNCTLMMTKSQDGINWSKSVKTDLPSCSVDVKLNTVTNKFSAFAIEGMHSATEALTIYESDNGLNWTKYFQTSLPNYAHNIGVTGDEYGHWNLDNATIAYGAPRGLNPVDTWGQWNMYMEDLVTGSINLIVETK